MRPPRSQKGERRGNCATDRGTFPLFFAEAGVVRGEIWPSGFIFFAVSARNHILQRFLTHLLLIGPERSRGKPKGRFVFRGAVTGSDNYCIYEDPYRQGPNWP